MSVRWWTIVKTWLLFVFIFMISSQSAYAEVNVNDLQGVLNGLVGPSAVNETNKPQYKDQQNLAESIDPQSGSLNLKITDLSLPGKNGLDFTLTRSYRSSASEYGQKKIKYVDDLWGCPYKVWTYTITVTNTNGSGGNYGSFQTFAAADAFQQTQQFRNMFPLMAYSSIGLGGNFYCKNITNIINPTTYDRSRYDLGAGWSFALPSVEMYDDELSGAKNYFLHEEGGAVYGMNYYPNSNSYSVNGHQPDDVEFREDTSYSNGQNTSKYVFIKNSKRKTFFAEDGRVLGIKDLLNNEIKFSYTNRTINGVTYPFIQQVVDSVGRTITFTYDNTINSSSFNGENIFVNVTEPSNTRSFTIKYTKWRDSVDGRYEPYLYSVTQAEGTMDSTTVFYNYSTSMNTFSFTKNGNICVIPAKLITSIIYPHSGTFYSYDFITRNLGGSGKTDAYRVKERFDKHAKAGEALNNSNNYNLALNKPVFASSVYQDEDGGYWGPGYAVDGIPITNWASVPGVAAASIYVDLGAVKSVKSVRLTWVGPFAPTYDLQYSNDAVNWTTIKRVTNDVNSYIDAIFTDVNARYIKMNGVAIHSKRWDVGYSPSWYALGEFEVFGDESLQDYYNYNYIGDFTASPKYNSLYDAPSAYTYSSEVTDMTRGLKTTHTYNQQTQPTEVKTIAKNGEVTLERNLTFASKEGIWLPTHTEITKTAADGTAAETLYVDKTYDYRLFLLSSTKPLTSSQLNNSTTRQNYTTTFEYDPTFKLIRQKQWKQSPTVTLTESVSYDGYGRIQSSTNSNGEVTTYNYTSSDEGDITETIISLETGKTARTQTVYGPLYHRAYPTKVKNYYTNENGIVTEATTTKTYDYLTGQVLSVTDAKGQTTTYTYDNLGRERTATLPSFIGSDGNTYSTVQTTEYAQYQTSTTFDLTNQNKLTTKVSSSTTITNLTTGAQGTYNYRIGFYDGFGNLLLQQLYDYQNNIWKNEAQYHYDGVGRPSYMGQPSSNNDVISVEKKVTYNAWGVPQITDAFGNLYVTDMDFVQRKVTSYMIPQASVATYRTDPNNLSYRENVLVVLKDQWGRAISRTAYPSWPSQAEIITEAYDYDIAGNLLTYTNPNNDVTTYNYDKLDRLVRVIDALSQVTSYDYTRLGNLKNTQQKDGVQTWITSKQYDELGRLIAKIDPAGQVEQFVPNELGQVSRSRDLKQVWFTNEFDQLNRMKTQTAAERMKKIYYGIETFGPTKVEEYVDNVLDNSIGYTYDSNGQVASVTTQNHVVGVFNTVNYEYNLTNMLTQVKHPDNFYTKYYYDKMRITKVQTNGNSNSNVTDDSQYAEYDYYGNGMLRSVTYPRLNDYSYLKTTYEYDKINRLKKITNTKDTQQISQYSYTYDNNGNIQTVTDASGTTSYAYDKLDRLVEVHRPDGSKDYYTYDMRGNRTSLQVSSVQLNFNDASYTYNTWNQLASSTENGKMVNFEYTPDDLRSRKFSPTETFYYSYNSSGKVIAESDANNVVKAEYIWGPDQLLVKNDKVSNTNYYYLYNGHGDVVQIVDTNGNVQNSYQYNEWGNIVGTPQENIRNSFKYAGEQFDTETGLYYLRARYYDPSIGRFINKDTYEGDITNPLSLNLYTYVHNNPLTNVDPTGHCVSGDESCDFSYSSSNHADENGILRLNDTNEIDYEWYLSWFTIDTIGFHKAAKENESLKEVGSTVVFMYLARNLPQELISSYLGNSVKTKKGSSGKETVSTSDCNCFVAGTKILTEEGEKNIEDVQVGDKVLSKDEATGEVGYKEVTATFNHESDEIYNIHVGGQTIESTFNHPFYVQGKGWTFVKDLKVGDLLAQSDGNTLKVDSIKLEHRQAAVYNLRVDGFHTYFVSDLGIWVHNTNCWGKFSADDLKKLGQADQKDIKRITGNANDAFGFFKEQVSGYKEVSPGVFVGKDANGVTFTYRASSKSGPSTIDVNGISGVRKIKFLED
ncbi:polymorphic toxin-type HINT domain-containing protein [Paenibacillus thalictri]|uniref:F5/8 type C domain-containing protein n=1 Tax=Paenibacillus thalictri TaxID=2527873 RepID=A0A4Q9DEA1_9BACL|nr:polymorphic toxin-type HINT domain-containing protein [Paenibacillus thalictri]TBL69886.1 hypothetical protein EYB31_34475 [Paenibacillus thalictri]